MFFKKKPKVKKTRICSCDQKYELIDSKLITNQYDPNVLEFGSGRRLTEEEYTDIVDSLQSEFEMYILNNGKIIPSTLMKSYMDDPVKVRKLADGRFKITVDGRHRAYVAMKNHLKLLVLVMEKEEYV